MIDFRYHLVSLVSVFLALAVGIVLGAGPLKGTIADTLSSSVDQLRGEAASLRTQRDTAQAAADNRDVFTESVLPTLVSQQLAGDTVVVVTLPGADTGAVKPLTQALATAGAKVTAQIDIKDTWTDPTQAGSRAAAVTSLNGLLTGQAAAGTSGPLSSTASPAVPVGSSPAPSVSGADPSQAALGGLLARALVTRSSGGGPIDGIARRLLDGLRNDGLVGVTGDVTGLAGQAVVLAPPVAINANPPSATPSGADPTPGWAALAVGLDAAGEGAVVVGPASSATNGGELAMIRGQQALTRVVSTIDTGGTPMGDVTTVFALREQGLGGVGSYGFVGKVDAPLPIRSVAGRS